MTSPAGVGVVVRRLRERIAEDEERGEQGDPDPDYGSHNEAWPESLIMSVLDHGPLGAEVFTELCSCGYSVVTTATLAEAADLLTAQAERIAGLEGEREWDDKPLSEGDRGLIERAWEYHKASLPVATVINDNQPGWTAIIETVPNITLQVGTKLYTAPTGWTATPDAERIAYWAGAYERMAARNIELSAAEAEAQKLRAERDEAVGERDHAEAIHARGLQRQEELVATLAEAVGLLRILTTGNYLECNDAINHGVPAFLAKRGGSA